MINFDVVAEQRPAVAVDRFPVAADKSTSVRIVADNPVNDMHRALM
jgi:hypothetical protein